MSKFKQYKTYVKSVSNKDGFMIVVWIVLTAIFLSLAWKIYRFVVKLFSGELGDEEDRAEAGKITTQIKKTVVIKPSEVPKSMANYELIADKLEKAMQGWGTDWTTIINVTNTLNAKELEMVYLKFGGRVNKDFLNEAYDLFGWLKSEYSAFSIPCQVAWPHIKAIWGKTKLAGRPI